MFLLKKRLRWGNVSGVILPQYRTSTKSAGQRLWRDPAPVPHQYQVSGATSALGGNISDSAACSVEQQTCNTCTLHCTGHALHRATPHYYHTIFALPPHWYSERLWSGQSLIWTSSVFDLDKLEKTAFQVPINAGFSFFNSRQPQLCIPH